jgi:microcystin-dependent protein
MAITIDGLLSLPDLPSAGQLATTDLLHVNQNAVDAKLSLLAITAYMMDKARPVGDIFWSSKKGVNPNTLFPGQTWGRLAGAGRQVRICANDESNLGSTGGSDTLVITAGNLPSHTHTYSGTVDGGGGHTPLGDIATAGVHTHTVNITTDSSGAHSHSVSGTISGDGSHGHLLLLTDTDDGSAGHDSKPAGGVATSNPDISSNSAVRFDNSEHGHAFRNGQTNNVGAHTHIVNGTTGQAGGHNHAFTGRPVPDHQHTFSGTTGATFSANPTAIDTAGQHIFYAAWTRTA